MDISVPALKASMVAQLQRNEVVANNLANITTTGFKKDLLFLRLLDEQADPRQKMQMETDYSTGVLEETNNPLDFAIKGRGFFAVELENGETAYTRDGHFAVDSDGRLVHGSGLPVLGNNGWIVLSQLEQGPGGELTLTEAGEIYLDNQFIDRLQISDFSNPQSLRKNGDNLFTVTAASVISAEENYQLQQGFLENSNVNPVEEMVQLVELQRQFESVQRMVRALDETFKLAAEQVGKV